MKLGHALSYLIEAILLALMLTFGILFVDNYIEQEQLQRDIRLKTALNKYAVELAVETVSARSLHTYHHDRYAQKQFEFEAVLLKLSLESEREQDLKESLHRFLENVTNYMQLSTMLKTSFRFISQFEIENTPHNHQAQNLARLVSSNISAFEKSIDSDKKRLIKEKTLGILEKTSVFEEQNKQWYMLKVHTIFVLKNLMLSDQFLTPIQNTKVNIALTNELNRLNHFQQQHYWNMVQWGILFISAIFGIFLAAILRQSFRLHFANREVKKSSQAKAEFLANMSHEIRTPMNGIMGLSDILLNSNLNTRQRSHLEKIKFSTKSLMTIINDILDFSKIESEKLDIEIVPFDVSELLDNVKAMMSNSAASKGLEFTIDSDKELHPQYKGDPVRIGQILLNLTSNAIKFTTKGHVLLRVSVSGREENQDIVSFSISDTGIGIEEEKLETLFQRFVQAESSTTREFGGTGLGLSICKMLSELMGGSIKATSKAGEGSEFSVTLPLGHSSRDIEEPSPDFTGKSILIIEDNLITQEITQKFADDLNLKTDVASTAREAIDKLSLNTYTYCLLDWVLPDASGESLLEEARTQLSDDKIIIFTSYDAEEISTAGNIQILTKPLLRSSLTQALQQSTENTNDSSNSEETEQNPGEDQSIISPPKISYGEKFRVLLVDDNEINIFVAEETLHELDVDVTTATNGKIAVDLAMKENFDLILMDIQMPVMDGMEATTLIRKKFTAEALPIIALTANVMEHDITKYKDLGMNDHLGKPFEAEQILALVDSYVRQKESQSIHS